MLKAIERPNLPKEIIRQIVSEVGSGNLRPGDKLPSERELGELFNVGRGSIREGLKVLETVGIVKRTTGGTILCQPGEIEDPSIWLRGCRAEIHEVFETRKFMEIELAGLAAQRATPKDIKKIGEAIVQSYDVFQPQAVDVPFHRSIVEAAKNNVFLQVYNLAAGLLFQTYKYYSLIEINEQSIKNIIAQHKEIARAIASHDSKTARKTMRQHLDYAETLVGKMEKDFPKGIRRIR